MILSLALKVAPKLALKNILEFVSFLTLFVEYDMGRRRFKIMDISKKDWKLFREKLSDWQEKYIEGLIKEYVNYLNDDTNSGDWKSG